MLLDEGSAERRGGDRHRDPESCGRRGPRERRRLRPSSASREGWPAPAGPDRPTCTASGRSRSLRPSRAASSASSISPSVAIPVETSSGRRVCAAARISGRSTISNEAIFRTGTSSASSSAHRLVVEGRREEVDPTARGRSREARAATRGAARFPRAARRGLVADALEVLELRRLRGVDPVPEYVWNLTASAPAPTATSIRRCAVSRSRLWLAPTSAMT